MNSIVKLILKIFILTIILYALYSFASTIVGIGDLTNTTVNANLIIMSFLMCLLHVIAITYCIQKSCWGGWKLVATVFWVYFGIMTFLTQVESIVFLNFLTDNLQSLNITKMFLQGIIVSAIFSPVVVYVLGKIKAVETKDKINSNLSMPLIVWVKRLIVIAVIYIIIYISFGALVFKPLAGNAFNEYYGDLQTPAWILLFQGGRALIWTAIAVPVINMVKGKKYEKKLAVALLFSFIMGSLMLVPTDIMPPAISKAHLVEVFVSNFVFGWILVYILDKPYLKVSKTS